jgi:tetratricopeptide (TPR) repeat protein
VFLLDVAIPDAETEDLHDALANLAAVSLVMRELEGDRFAVHRLVQDVTRRSLDPSGSRQRLTEALGWANAAFTDDPGDARTWSRLDRLAPHAQTVTESADAAGIMEPTARLMNHLGVFFKLRSLAARAEPLYRRALTIVSTRLGPDHPDVATALNNLAELLRATNRLAEAEPLFRHALAIDEANLQPNHPRIATVLSNLVLLLQATNRLAKAEPLIRRALAIAMTKLGSDHPATGDFLNNLAGLLESIEQVSDTELLYRRALAILEATFGPDHPKVAIPLNNLARLLQAANRYSEAEPLMRRHLEPDHES